MDPELQAYSQKLNAGERVVLRKMLENVAERYGKSRSVIYNIWHLRHELLHDWRIINTFSDVHIEKFHQSYFNGANIAEISAMLQSASGRAEFERRFFPSEITKIRQNMSKQLTQLRKNNAKCLKEPDFLTENMDIPDAGYRMRGNAYQTPASIGSGMDNF